MQHAVVSELTCCFSPLACVGGGAARALVPEEGCIGAVAPVRVATANNSDGSVWAIHSAQISTAMVVTAKCLAERRRFSQHEHLVVNVHVRVWAALCVEARKATPVVHHDPRNYEVHHDHDAALRRVRHRYPSHATHQLAYPDDEAGVWWANENNRQLFFTVA